MTPKEFAKHVTPLTVADVDLIESYVSEESTNYYDLAPYAVGSCTYSIFKGYKYHDGETLILFKAKYAAHKHWKVYKAWGKNPDAVLDRLFDWWNAYKTVTDNNLRIENITPEQLDVLLPRFKAADAKPSKALGVEDVFDIDGLTELRGKKWSRLRALVNRFRRDYPVHSLEPISTENIEEAQALLKVWVKQKKERGAVQLNYKQYEYVLLNHSFESDRVCSFLCRIDGKPAAVVLCNWVSPVCFVHTAAFYDMELYGVNDFTTYATLSEVELRGYKRAASGVRMTPKWLYKDRLNPITPKPQWYQLTLVSMPKPAEGDYECLFET